MDQRGSIDRSRGPGERILTVSVNPTIEVPAFAGAASLRQAKQIGNQFKKFQFYTER
jgi:hypothetical protein